MLFLFHWVDFLFAFNEFKVDLIYVLKFNLDGCKGRSGWMGTDTSYMLFASEYCLG